MGGEREHHLDLKKVGKYDHLVKDQPVVVWNYTDDKHKRYFSHAENEKAIVFTNGFSSWGAVGSTPFENCRAATLEEIEAGEILE